MMFYILYYYYFCCYCCFLTVTSALTTTTTIQQPWNHDKGLVERTVVLLYYKPPHTITSHTNNDASPAGGIPRRTVYQDIETLQGYTGPRSSSSVSTLSQLTNIHSKLHAVGRLDAETAGLLLLTNDGGLIHHVCNPTAHAQHERLITKTYRATIMGYHDHDAPGLQTLRTLGVHIGDKYGGMTKPAIRLLVEGHSTNKSTDCIITIAEGKNRQVRRMFHAIGSGVMKLTRIAMGNDTLTLGDLKEGQWRILTHDEVKLGLGWEPRILLPSPSAKLSTMNKSRKWPASDDRPRKRRN